MSVSSDLAARAAATSALVAPVKMLEDGLEMAQAERDAAIADKQTAVTLLAQREQVIAQQAKRIAELEAVGPGPVPPPPDPDPDPLPPPTPTRKTLFGACPASGSAASVITKFGTGAAVRWFTPNGLTTVPTRPAGCSLFHASWKPFNAGQTLTDALVLGACKNLTAGDMVTVEHEPDVKWQKDGNNTSLLARLALAADFHTRVKRLRPDLITVCVLGGWQFHPSSGRFTSQVMGNKFYAPSDYLGVDLDGWGAPIDWRPALPNIKTYANARYGGKWTVPEYGEDEAAGRLAKMKAEIPDIVGGVVVPKPAAVIFFDNSSVAMTNAAEIAYWKGLVAGGAA